MSGGRRFKRAFAWLSLTATLLLALLPSVGRLAAAHHEAPRTVLMELCTTGSDKLVSMVDPFALLETPPPAPMDHGDMPDCAYCPLLATTLIAVLWLAWSLAPPIASPLPILRTRRVLARHPCGLGSRGPPLAA
ncbi:DUF2946 family protein [Luteimonas sp. TWI662]|uniref:DUF2946 family protein n=1 Tax=Luteimonas sp. TWI662 TaxID=3136789 RepID=UPI00320ABF80